jgi:hypothetical protein
MAGCGAPGGGGDGEAGAEAAADAETGAADGAEAGERGIDNFDTTYRCHCLEAWAADR